MTTETVFVHTKSGNVSCWSRYVFPFAIDAFAQRGNVLYVRHGDSVSIVDEDATTDSDGSEVTATIQWNWIDCGQPGVTKMLEGVDIVATGATPSVSIGYDQSNLSAFTTPLAVSVDSLPGGRVRIPVRGPSFSVKVTYSSIPFVLSAVQLRVMGVQGQP